MTAPTITIPDIGTVPALPDALQLVAYAARDMPARTWGVVARVDDGDPMLYVDGLPNSVTAGRIAAQLATVYGPDVYAVHRCPTAVTVHTAHPELPGNLVGTVPAPAKPPARADVAALAVHVRDLADGLHEYAIAAHRRERMHRAPMPADPADLF